MANILIVWEYERENAHIAKLQCLQKQLTTMGHTVYLIGTNFPTTNEEALLLFLPAPQCTKPLLHKSRSITKIGGFTDRLALLGFNNNKTLDALVNAWDNFFTLLKPQLLICDCAPVASLAAYKTIPVIQFSDGLSLPPFHLENFPRLRPDVPPLASTTEILQNIQYVQNKRKKSHITSLPQLVRGEHQFICHIPEFDPYFTFRDPSTQYGPFYTLSDPIVGPCNHFFAYLDKDYPDIEEVAISLSDMGETGIFYIPGASSALLTFLDTVGMIVYDYLPNFKNLLNQCNWVIHHGSISLSEAALAAGIPQFTLPYHFENELVSQALVKMNVAVSIRPHFHPVTTTAQCIREGYQPSLLEWSALRAQHLKLKNYFSLEPTVLNACQRLLQ